MNLSLVFGEDFFWPNLNAGKVKQASGLVLITRVQNIMVPFFFFFFHFLCFEGIVICLWGHFWLSFHSTWLNRSECCLCLVRYGGEGERQSKGWSVAPWSVGSLCGYKERRHLWLHLVRLIESSAARNCLWRKWDFPLPKCISQHSLFQAILQGSVQFSFFFCVAAPPHLPHTHLLADET